MPAFAVILPAAGKSSRFGGREKKPFVNLDNTAVWLRAANLFANRPDVVQTILVISPDDRELVLRRYSANLMFLGVKVVDGGAERFVSVANALAHVKPEADFVAVTLKRVDNQMTVTQTVPRLGLWQAQTPQVFRKDWLVEAYGRTGATSKG